MKTMRKKCLKQSLSILLAFIFACSMIPTAIAAALTAEKSEASKIVREITELREESVKHFLCEDGSYIAATYAVPVHYQENGVWKEIDNSLSLTSRTIDASAKSAYAPKAGSVDVNLPQSFADGQKITARNGEHTLSFGVSADAKNVSIGKQAAVTKVDALPSVVMEEKELTTATTLPDNVVSSKAVSESVSEQDYNDEKMAVANQSGAVVYKGIFDDADLEYIVSSGCVKENIVVYAPQETYTYAFNMNFGDLIPAQQKNGSIWLLESADADEPVFVLETPYMYDADNMDSYAVTMSLEPHSDGYTMTVEADAEWINSAERAFPVVIDPTIEYSNVSYFDDMYVINGLGSNSSHRNTELRVGRNLTNLARTYIQISLPSNIPENGVVTNAMLTLKQKSYYQAWNQSNVNIKVLDCDHAHGYAFNAITWNNQPFSTSNTGYTSNGATQLDQKPATSSANSYSFTITDALRRWATEDRALQQNQGQGTGGTQNANDNHYLMLASDNESSKTQIDLGSTRISDTSKRPVVTIAYVNASLIFSAVPGEITTWTVDATGDLQSVVVSPSRVWTVDVDEASQSWLSVENINLVGFRIRVEENTSVCTRSGCITVRFDSVTEVVKVINIVQMGTEPTLYMLENQLYSYSEGGTLYVELFSNTSWSVDPVVSEQSGEIVTQHTATVSPMSGYGNTTLEITVDENTEAASALHTITVRTDVDSEITETITIKQFDRVSDYFNNITNGTCSMRTPSQYNHPLATWAMELSYIAYNYLNGQQLAPIPGAFMEDYMKQITITNRLDQDAFTWMHSVGYDSTLDTLAYTIATRMVDIGEESRNLVLVVTRGSVSAGDLWSDISAQFTSGSAFGTRTQEIVNAVHGKVENDDTIIVVTGHSLGAAAANLAIAKLNQTALNPVTINGLVQEKNLYGYTFGTPKVVDGEALNTNSIPYTNLFNILNNNDVVTFVPFDVGLDSILQEDSSWFRYGQDYHITMPMKLVAVKNVFQNLEKGQLGFGGHAMPTYYSWMNTLGSKLNKNARSIDLNDLISQCENHVTVGLLPIIVRFKCPVDTSIIDENNTLLAYESCREGYDYPVVDTNSEIVSWKTDSNEKYFFIPYGHDVVQAQAVAYDYGSMQFSVGTVGFGELATEKVFNNVSLYPEKEFTASVSPEIPANDVQLFQVLANGEQEEITELNPLLKSVTVQNPHVSYGTPNVIVVVTDITVTKVQFIDRDTESTITYNRTAAGIISLVEDGDNLIWTIQRVFTTGNPRVYHVRVKVGNTWYDRTENAFAIYVT